MDQLPSGPRASQTAEQHYLVVTSEPLQGTDRNLYLYISLKYKSNGFTLEDSFLWFTLHKVSDMVGVYIMDVDYKLLPMDKTLLQYHLCGMTKNIDV